MAEAIERNRSGLPVDLIERLRERHTPEPVPPCRVCGEPLDVAHIGGGRLTGYACTSEAAKKSLLDWPEGDDHYRRSRWVQPRHGDPDVLELIRQYEQCIDLAAGGRLDG